MNKTFCDFCGQEITKEDLMRSYTTQRIDLHCYGLKGLDNQYFKYDVCPHCSKEIPNILMDPTTLHRIFIDYFDKLCNGSKAK